MLGTPVYMAPEQCRNARSPPRSDIYALGGVLFHMVPGARRLEDSAVTSSPRTSSGAGSGAYADVPLRVRS